MCGIVGVVDTTGLSLNQTKFFKQGLYIDALRGLHSTGVAALTKKFDTQIYKRAVNASDFLQLSAAEKVMEKYGTKIMLLGHNRHATMGDLIDDNAHPFQHGAITMVHNGSLRSQWELDNNAQFDVDSEVIAFNLNKNGVDETVPKLNGAFSLVWHDANDNTLNFVRNSERPMCYAMVSKTAMVFGSEAHMIALAAHRNSISFIGNKIHRLDAGDLMSFDLTAPELSATHKSIDLKEDSYGWNSSSRRTPAKKEEKEAEKKEESKVIGLDGKPLPTSQLHLPSKKKHRTPYELLYELDFKVEEEVEFVCVGWTHNSTNSLGVLEGYLQDDAIAGHKPTWADVEVYSTPDKFDEGALYRGTIVGAREDKDGVGILILNPKTIELVRQVPWEEEKKEEEVVEQASEEGELILGGEHQTGTFLLGYGDKYIPIAEWDRATKEGCSHCGDNLFPQLHREYLWLGHQTVLCPACQDRLDSQSSH